MATDFAEYRRRRGTDRSHWKVINYLRNYYLQFGIAPMIRKLCKETGFKLNEIYTAVPVRAGQGRLQAGRSAETDRLRLAGGDEHAQGAHPGAWIARDHRIVSAARPSRFSPGRAIPFRNPVGHTVRQSSRRCLFEQLLGNMDPEPHRACAGCAHPIRAVQDLEASQAVGFVFLLKAILRELAPEARTRAF